MTSGLGLTISIAAAYVVGSIPVGWLIARYGHGIDLRTAGSGNIGATNVGRTLGRTWGIVCLLCDFLKGVAGTMIPLLTGLSDAWKGPAMVACGAAAVLGHVFPIWLGFRGGKGVATGAGVAIVLAWPAALAAGAAFAIIFAMRRVVSLSSMIAAIVYAVFALALNDPLSRENWPLATFAVAIPSLIVFRHRDNIRRLLRGEEKPFTAAKSRDDSQETPVAT